MSAELSVLIVNYNTWRECADALASLRRCPPTRPDGSPMPYEAIVVDNKSPQQPPDLIARVRQELLAIAAEQQDPACGQLILHDDNAGYSKGVNLCFHKSRGRWILVSNPDLVFAPGLIGKLQRHLENDPRAGCVVPKGCWDTALEGRLPPNTLPTLTDLAWTTLGEFSRTISRWYGKRLAKGWLRVWAADRPLALPMMSGCLFLIERAFFQSIGLMDERYPLYYEDADLSVTIRKAGRTVTQVPDAELVHLVNRSGLTDPETMMRRHDVSRRLYFRKWYGRLGTLALDVVQWLLTASWLRRLRPAPPHRRWQALGPSADKPVLTLPRACDRFLLLMSLDCRFYLAGGLFGSGASWTPSDAVFANFTYSDYWYQAFDLTAGRFEPIGMWRFSSRRHLGVACEDVGSKTP